MGWTAISITDSGYISDNRLSGGRMTILVTREVANGRRYVAQAKCAYGRLTSKGVGKVIAWMPMLEPYRD